jgi:glycosyltransferase involved in cell wall biosynthesis
MIPLKVLHLSELYPPEYGGGAAAYVQETCRYLSEKGNDIRVLCTKLSDHNSYSIITDFDRLVRVERVNVPFRQIDPGGWHLTIEQWKTHKQRILSITEDIFKEWQPDIVNFHTPYPLLEEILPNLLERNIPVVGMLHCSWTICPRLNSIESPTGNSCSGPGLLRCLKCLYSNYDGNNAKAFLKMPWRVYKFGSYPAQRLLERKETYLSIDGVFGYSKFISDHHRKFIKTVEYIPLGVDLTGLPNKRSIRPRKPIRFVFNGGFQEHKGIWDILDTAQSLKARGYSFEIHIWGPRQDSKELKKRLIEDCVFLRGLFTTQTRWNVYDDSDVLLMATRVIETAPRVLQEAAAMGVPSIAPNQGGITEVIDDGVNGLLYNFLDRKDLENQMIKILEQPKLVQKLANNLWKVVDIREAVGDIEKFYLKIINVKKAKGV